VAILYAYLDPLTEADEISGELWELMTAIHDECDSVILYV